MNRPTTLAQLAFATLVNAGFEDIVRTGPMQFACRCPDHDGPGLLIEFEGLSIGVQCVVCAPGWRWTPPRVLQ